MNALNVGRLTGFLLVALFLKPICSNAQSLGLRLNNLNNFINKDELDEDTTRVPDQYKKHYTSFNLSADYISRGDGKLKKRIRLGHYFVNSTGNSDDPNTSNYYVVETKQNLQRTVLGLGIGDICTLQNERFFIYYGLELLNEFEWKNIRSMQVERYNYSNNLELRSNEKYKFGNSYALSLLTTLAPYYRFGRIKVGFELNVGFWQKLKYSKNVYTLNVEDFQSGTLQEETVTVKDKDSSLSFTNYFSLGVRYSLNSRK